MEGFLRRDDRLRPDRFLRPGTRVLRRLPVTGKFVVIALALITPLSVLAGASAVTVGREVRAVDQEAEGLRLARPLTHLITDLHQWRIAAATGQPLGDLATALGADVAAVDRAEAQTDRGDRLTVHSEWLQLRERIQALRASTTSGPRAAGPDGAPAARVAAATRALPTPDEYAAVTARTAVSLLDRVASASRLVLDPRLDTSALAVVLVDRLPALLEATASAAENLPTGRPPSGEASAIARQITAPARRLTADLGTAVSATTWDRLDTRLRGPGGAVQNALSDYTAVVSGEGVAALAGQPDVARRLTSSAAALDDELADSLAHLLAARREATLQSSAVPLTVALVSLAVAGYLFGAMMQATRRDVRQVLGEINALTGATLLQTNPLDGSDEFAQMSRAAVVARDHLTSLLGTLRYQGTHDELTALANRGAFAEKLADHLAHDADDGHQVAVVVVDLDGFKDVNDSFGHAIGDRLLRALGARVHRAARRRGLVARIGADQFGVLLTDAADGRATRETVAALQHALSEPVDVDGRLLRVKASVGVAITPDGGTTATELLRNADVAMHAAKVRGGGGLTIFEPAMHEAIRERTELSSDLVLAVEQLGGTDRHQFWVAYQPLVDLRTGRIHGVEALARWSHPDRGPVPPDVFVPLAEATGVIVPIGRWILREATRQLAAWRAELPTAADLTMEVNLAADQLGDPGLVEEVLTLISETGIDPRSLVLEITESAVVRDLDTALRRLAQLSAMGVRIALDDFGTGYSSLSYLQQLPVTVLKIDKSFVSASDHSGSAAVLLGGIVSLGTGLGMQIVAEGVETPLQARRLRETGCDLGQGFLWSRPVDAAALGALLSTEGALAEGTVAEGTVAGGARAEGAPAHPTVPGPRRGEDSRSPSA